MEAAFVVAKAQMETLEAEYDQVTKEKQELELKKMCFMEPKFNDVVNAFRLDPAAALIKYTAIQNDQLTTQTAIDTITARHSDLKSQMSILKPKLLSLRAVIQKEKKDKDMVPFIEKYGTVVAKDLREQAESIHNKLLRMWRTHDDNHEEHEKKLNIELDAIAKVLMNNHGIKVEYRNNCIFFTDSAVGEKRKREHE